MSVDHSTYICNKSQLSDEFRFEPTFLPDYLFDFQKYLVDWAIPISQRSHSMCSHHNCKVQSPRWIVGFDSREPRGRQWYPQRTKLRSPWCLTHARREAMRLNRRDTYSK